MTIHFTKIRRFTVPKGVFDFNRFTHVLGMRKVFGFKQKTMTLLIDEKGFPPPIHIGKRRYWNIDAVERYLKKKALKSV